MRPRNPNDPVPGQPFELQVNLSAVEAEALYQLAQAMDCDLQAALRTTMMESYRTLVSLEKGDSVAVVIGGPDDCSLTVVDGRVAFGLPLSVMDNDINRGFVMRVRDSLLGEFMTDQDPLSDTHEISNTHVSGSVRFNKDNPAANFNEKTLSDQELAEMIQGILGDHDVVVSDLSELKGDELADVVHALGRLFDMPELLDPDLISTDKLHTWHQPSNIKDLFGFDALDEEEFRRFYQG